MSTLVYTALAGNKGRHWYSVMAALRGPDHEDGWSQDLKAIFTARIRFLVAESGDETRPHAWGIGGDERGNHQRSLWPDSLLDLLTHLAGMEYDEAYACFRHYLQHVEYGLDSLNSLALIEGDEYLFLSSLIRAIYNAINYAGDDAEVEMRKVVADLFATFPQFFYGEFPKEAVT